ncbi:hypothetical protein [Neobacillus sp. LXY-1]|uniref:hypothetical protein n=1 Tax=Neobacillus sp. LXY-1 TaxID=3379133 RepID=UPI003EE2EDC2
MTEKENTVEKQFSSLDLVWKIGLDEVDAWAERYNKRDEKFLEMVKSYVETVKRNQENVKTVSEQFGRELKEWEKAAREELMVTTTSLQHFFPVKSYEEINQVVDDIQNKTASILLTPIQSLNNLQALDKYLDAVEQYINYRKKARQKYIDSVKKTTAVLYENQKVIVDLVSKQVKSAIFPFQKYIQNVSELTKS